ncbi:hypothetical protein FKP32DRAFT_1539359, partial [Trametes sanguinea]
MWLKSYLAIGMQRPPWAIVADDIMSTLVPLSTPLKSKELRMNAFLQTWKPAKLKLPAALKDMVAVAKKYGLRQEGRAFERSILRSMPAWDHAQGEVARMRKLSIKSTVTTCLRRKHNIRTVGDLEAVAIKLDSDGHTGGDACTCKACEDAIVETRCTHPHRCFERARAIMDAIPSKWDPRGLHPEDYEDAMMEAAEGTTPDVLFDRRVTTKGLLADTFRIFTNNDPVDNDRLDTRIEMNEGFVEVATDGSCTRNGETTARAGAGIYCGQLSAANRSIRLPPNLAQTNQTGEMVAIIEA